jgi:hypothetical protein
MIKDNTIRITAKDRKGNELKISVAFEPEDGLAADEVEHSCASSLAASPTPSASTFLTADFGPECASRKDRRGRRPERCLRLMSAPAVPIIDERIAYCTRIAPGGTAARSGFLVVHLTHPRAATASLMSVRCARDVCSTRLRCATSCSAWTNTKRLTLAIATS